MSDLPICPGCNEPVKEGLIYELEDGVELIVHDQACFTAYWLSLTPRSFAANE